MEAFGSPNLRASKPLLGNWLSTGTPVGRRCDQLAYACGEHSLPAMRKTLLRELMVSLRARGQVGFQSTMRTNAASRFSCMAYRGATRVSLSWCASKERLPMPILPPKRRWAIAPAILPGEYSWFKERGLTLRKAHEPRALRKMAACKYLRDFGQLSKNWDWVSQPLNISAPADHLRAHGIAPIMNFDPDPIAPDTLFSRENAAPIVTKSASPSSLDPSVFPTCACLSRSERMSPS